ncbi:acyl-CoA dehydrogenase family protein [Ammoniphilus resinae]|uniref:Alkylation response protein AidB-like acyl-CoA dehydrogenase n=1 Tax=Ammoniphilus resinae TaxID=861532 RepID=A0ABS4GLC9_9BACL|nr:acyl-CoA dehydrogenase family protein [Ammoniphilus resinae]MBP1931049.1 alkylation response protein AidB-like acyl-CoA dehydrogenase [Ammoniphilus resinae]
MKNIDYFVRNEKEAALVAMVERLAEVFAGRAAKHDLEGSFPFDNIAGLKEAGYLKLTVPKKYGGDEISLYEMVLAQERLARGDGSTALAVGWHIGLVHHYRYTRDWPEELFERFCRDVVAEGAMINHFSSEPKTGSPTRGGRPETVVEETEGGWLITGRKSFSTLSPALDQFIVSAYMADEDEVGLFFVRKQDGVSIEETWNTIGMRATGSHDVLLDHVFVPSDALLRKKSETKSDGDGWLLHIPACYLGIAYAARDFAVNYAQNYRPNSLPGPIAELPHIESQIGIMEEKLITARTLLYSVADRWDKHPDQRIALQPERALAKKVATNTALEIVDAAMRIVGGASLSRSLPLERWYRDVRAGLHNPPMDDSVLKLLAKRALLES